MRIRPETYLTRLIETATSTSATPDQLATAMVQTIEKLADASPVGPEAMAIVRNKVLRQHLADAFNPRQSTGKQRSASSSALTQTPSGRPPMSAETRAKIAKSAAKRWAKIKKDKKKSETDVGANKKSAAAAKARAKASHNHEEAASAAS